MWSSRSDHDLDLQDHKLILRSRSCPSLSMCSRGGNGSGADPDIRVFFCGPGSSFSRRSGSGSELGSVSPQIIWEQNQHYCPRRTLVFTWSLSEKTLLSWVKIFSFFLVFSKDLFWFSLGLLSIFFVVVVYWRIRIFSCWIRSGFGSLNLWILPPLMCSW